MHALYDEPNLVMFLDLRTTNECCSFEKSVLLFPRVFFCFVLVETDNYQTKLNSYQTKVNNVRISIELYFKTHRKRREGGLKFEHNLKKNITILLYLTTEESTLCIND